MSAPNTDPEKQKKRHRAPLLGIRGVVLWALVLLVLLTIFLFVRGDQPGEGDAASPTGEAETPALAPAEQ